MRYLIALTLCLQTYAQFPRLLGALRDLGVAFEMPHGKLRDQSNDLYTLLLQAHSGDEKAVNEFILRVTPYLWDEIYPRIPELNRAADALQEALLSCLQVKFLSQPHLSIAYFRKIAKHRALRIHSRLHKQKTFNETDLGDRSPLEGPTLQTQLSNLPHWILTPEERLMESEFWDPSADLFEEIQKGLPPQYREMVRWRLVDGLTKEQITERLGITVNNVKVAWHRAIKTFLKRTSAGELWELGRHERE